MAVEIETGQEMLAALRQHILQLNALSKNLQSGKNFDDLENEWLVEPIRTKHVFSPPYWRGADVQVIEVFEGETLADWKKHEDLHVSYYSTDDPIPSRYPKLLSALIREIDRGAHYLDFQNKFEFYFQFSKTCIELELSGGTTSKVRLCSTVIFNQIRLLSEWIQRIEIELRSPRKPSLIELGWSYYFAFGRNVNRTAMLGEDRCPKAVYLGQAELKNHRFAIDERGYASVIPKHDAKAIGVLWAISPEDESRLDRKEGVQNNIYRKEQMSVSSNEAAFFGGPEEVTALVYVSNSLEGETPRTGYVEEIIEGLKEALYSDRNLDLYRSYLGTRPPINTIQQPSSVEHKLTIRKILYEEQKLSPRFQKILCGAAEEAFSTRKNDDTQTKIFSLFAALNRCFNENASDQANVDVEISDAKSFGNFLTDFIPENSLKTLYHSDYLKEFKNLNPLITSDKMILDKGLDPYSLNPEDHAELTEKASSDHKQFLREFQKIDQSFTNAKMKRLLKKLARLLYTIRSNTVHGSKLATVDNEERIERVCEITINVLFDLIDVLIGGGLRKIAVYGELKKDGSLHSNYMQNFTFLSAATIKGHPWNKRNIVWLDLDQKEADYAAELYLVPDHLAFNQVDKLELKARRVLTQYCLEDRTSGVCWAYSRKKELDEVKIETPILVAPDPKSNFTKADAVAWALSLKLLRKKLENRALDESESEVQFPKLFLKSTSVGKVETNLNVDKIDLNISGNYPTEQTVSIAFKFAAELEFHVSQIENIYLELFPGGTSWPCLLEDASNWLREEILFFIHLYPFLIKNPSEEDLRKFTLDLISTLYTGFETQMSSSVERDIVKAVEQGVSEEILGSYVPIDFVEEFLLDGLSIELKE